MGVAAKLDDLGKPAWIGLMILGFMAWWPIGLAILGFLIWSGRMGCWKHGGHGRWQHEYREETLRRLEDEQREFMEFLDRLRQAKDKAEFDQFMADRTRRPPQAPE